MKDGKKKKLKFFLLWHSALQKAKTMSKQQKIWVLVLIQPKKLWNLLIAGLRKLTIKLDKHVVLADNFELPQAIS